MQVKDSQQPAEKALVRPEVKVGSGPVTQEWEGEEGQEEIELEGNLSGQEKEEKGEESPPIAVDAGDGMSGGARPLIGVVAPRSSVVAEVVFRVENVSVTYTVVIGVNCFPGEPLRYRQIALDKPYLQDEE